MSEEKRRKGTLLGVIAYNLVTLAEYIFVPWDRNNAGGGNET